MVPDGCNFGNACFSLSRLTMSIIGAVRFEGSSRLVKKSLEYGPSFQGKCECGSKSGQSAGHGVNISTHIGCSRPGAGACGEHQRSNPLQVWNAASLSGSKDRIVRRGSGGRGEQRLDVGKIQCHPAKLLRYGDGHDAAARVS